MKLILGIILLSILVIGIATIPSVDAASDGRLTIKGSHKSIDQGQTMQFYGKLTDRNGYAISGSNIILWESDKTSNKQLGSGTTDARGEYKITVTADYWDGIGNAVEIFAYSSMGSLKSTTLTINIDKARTTTSNTQVNNYVQPSTSIQKVYTDLVLEIKVDSNYFVELKPVLTTSDGNTLITDILIYVNEEKIGTVSSNKWSNIGHYESGYYSFTARFAGMTTSTIAYQNSLQKISHNLSDLIINSKTSSFSQTSSNSKINTDELYKSASSTRSTYSEILSQIESSAKASEYALSDLKLENSEAKKKIESGWDLRYDVWQYHGKAKTKVDNVKGYINTAQYDYSYKTLTDSESHIYNAKSHLYAVLDDLKDARDLEKKYQESKRSCFLFWCSDAKNTYGELDSKIKNLETKLDTLESKTKNLETNKNSFTQSLHKNEINEKNQEIKNLENIRKQDQLKAKQEQQRLEEQKQRELNNQRILDDQKQQRLEEQKQRELNNQRILADQKQQRLEEQKQREQEEYEARIESQKQSTLQILASQNPLLKQIMTGEITFWAEDVPYYAAPGVDYEVERMLDAFDSWSGVRRVYNESSADIRIQWIKEFSPHQGGQYWQSQVQVGLGQTACKGEWQPFTSHSVRQVLWHEIGHAMGHGHSSNQNNIMMGNGLDKFYEREYDDDIFLKDGHFSWNPFCENGQYTFSIKGSSDTSSFKFYVITPETNAKEFIVENKGKHYPDCTRDGQWFSSGSITCKVAKGAQLLIYNPRDNGESINVDVITKYTGGKTAYSMTWDPNTLRESSQYLQYLDSLR